MAHFLIDIFIFIDIFENHTTDGGFETFFWDSAGQFSHEILEAYERIGALETASIIYDSFLLLMAKKMKKMHGGSLCDTPGMA